MPANKGRKKKTAATAAPQDRQRDPGKDVKVALQSTTVNASGCCNQAQAPDGPLQAQDVPVIEQPTKPNKGQRIDVRDARGRWYDCVCTKQQCGGDDAISVHYRTWPSEFDEDAVPLTRVAPAHTHVVRWRDKITPGQHLELFCAYLQRWCLVKVVQVEEAKGVQLSCAGSKDRGEDVVYGDEWVPTYSENLAPCGTHLGIEEGGSVAQGDDRTEAKHPNGTARALEVAKAALLRDDRVIWVCILMELCDQGVVLPQEVYASMLQRLQRGQIVRHVSVEGRRWRGALVDVLAERKAQAASGLRAERYQPSSLDSTPDVEIVVPSAAALGNELGMTPLRLIDELLRYKEPFHQALDGVVWKCLRVDVKQLLQMADACENAAENLSLTMARRRLLQAEACRLMEMAEDASPMVRPYVYFRLARAYVGGVGLREATDLATQEAADIQALQYLCRSGIRTHPAAMFLYGLLISLGRGRIIFGHNSQIAWTEAMKLIFEAAAAKYPPAMYYRARLLIEGVVDADSTPTTTTSTTSGSHTGVAPVSSSATSSAAGVSTAASRVAALKEAIELLHGCGHEFNAVSAEAVADAARARALLQLSFTADTPHYDLSLHIFTRTIQQHAHAALAGAVYEMVKRVARDHCLMLPADGSSSVASPSAQWCRSIADRFRVYAHAGGGTGVGGGGDGPAADGQGEGGKRRKGSEGDLSTASTTNTAQVPDMSVMYVKQRLNELLLSAPLDPTSTTLSFTATSWSKEAVEDVMEGLCAVCLCIGRLCRPLDGLVYPPKAVAALVREVEFAVVAASIPSSSASRPTAEQVDQEDLATSTANTPSPPAPSTTTTTTYRFLTTNPRNLWKASLAHAALVTQKMPHAFLRERVECLSEVERVRAVDRGVSDEEAVEVAVLSRRLARDARGASPQMDKHVLSARAVRAYAAQHVIDVGEALKRLDDLASKLLAGLPPSGGYISRIGYHTVLEAQRVMQFTQNAQTRAPCPTTERVEYLRESAELNSGWRGSNSGEPSLLDTFFQFRTLVERIQDSYSDAEVAPNLAALTFSDPWALFATGDVDHAVSDVLKQAHELSRDDVGNSSLDCQDSMLIAAIFKSFVQLERAHPSFPAVSIMDRLSGYKQLAARVLLKKKMLHLLRTAPDVDWDTGRGLEVLAHQLQDALEGRCPDGIASFCDQFQQESCHRKLTSDGALRPHMPSNEVSRLITAVSLMVSQMKQLFIKRHLSRHPDHYEHRTVAYTTLHTMLLLPLSLPGDFSYIRYPHYSEEGIYKPKGVTYKPLASVAVCKRYLLGGQVVFEYDSGVRDSVNFPELSLRRIVNTLRAIIVHSDATAAEDDVQRELPQHVETQGLYLRARLDYHVEETVIEEFAKGDLVLGTAYMEAWESEWTLENLFFQPLRSSAVVAEDGIGVAVGELEGGKGDGAAGGDNRPTIARVMKDAAFVRMLQVCNYCSVSAGFYERLNLSWTIPAYVQPRNVTAEPQLVMTPPPSPQSRMTAGAQPSVQPSEGRGLHRQQRNHHRHQQQQQTAPPQQQPKINQQQQQESNVGKTGVRGARGGKR